MANTYLKITELTQTFGKKHALNKVSISFKAKRIYALTGNNGAGKTTLLKNICGLLKPTHGSIDLMNKELKVGALLENPGLFTDMSAYENIKAKTLCLGIKCTKADILSLLELVGLGDVGRKRAGKFSMGMKQCLGIALALVGDPDVLIFDEPTNSLDPQGINDFRKIITHINKTTEKCIIVSSHNLDELSKFATDFIVIKKGEVVKDCTKEEFIKECGDMTVDDYYLKLACD